MHSTIALIGPGALINGDAGVRPNPAPKYQTRLYLRRASSAVGSATTEVGLLAPLLMLFLFRFARVFALLVLLCSGLFKRMNACLGFGTTGARDLDRCKGRVGACLELRRTQVLNIATLTVKTKPMSSPIFQYLGAQNRKALEFPVTKFAPNRDRPIAFVLQGISN